MFVLAIMVQLLLICLSSEITALAEKADRSLSKDKLNLGLATLVLILAAYSYFWLRFWPMMHSPGVNLVLGLLQLSSLYVAVTFWSKLRNDSAI